MPFPRQSDDSLSASIGGAMFGDKRVSGLALAVLPSSFDNQAGARGDGFAGRARIRKFNRCYSPHPRGITVTVTVMRFKLIDDQRQWAGIYGYS